MTDLRVSQVYVEVLTDLATPDLRVSHVDAEVLTDLPTPTLQVSSVTAEVLTDLPTPDLQISLVYVEVLEEYDPYQVSAVVVAATTTIPAPTVDAGAGGDTTVNATVVPAVAAVTGHTPSAGATVSPAVVAGVTAVTGHTPSAGATVSPAVVAGVTAVPAPTVDDGGANATVNATVVPAVAAVGAATESAGATVTPAVVPGVTTVGTATEGAGATVTPAVVDPGEFAGYVWDPVVTADDPNMVTAVVVPAVTTVPDPVVTGQNTVDGNTGGYTPPSIPGGDVPPFAPGDSWLLAAPRSGFQLTYVPIPYSEHITVSQDTTVWRKLRRGSEWRTEGRDLIFTDDLERIFRGSGPWWLDAQYAYGGVGDSGVPAEGDPPPDPDDPDVPTPPVVPVPPGATYYGSSPNGASGGPKQAAVEYVHSIFGGLKILRAFDDFPTAWSDTRTARFAAPGVAVAISLKPGMANLAEGRVTERIKSFLRTIPASIPMVIITCHHEPENDTSAIPPGEANTGRLYRSAMLVFLQCLNEVRAEGKCQNVLSASILMSFSVLHRNPEDWYVPGVDILGWDTYNRANLTALRNYSIAKGKPWAVMEIGAKPVANYTDAQYANELEAFYGIWTSGATQPVAVCYFQSTVGDNYVITPETRPISVAWWRYLVENGVPQP